MCSSEGVLLVVKVLIANSILAIVLLSQVIPVDSHSNGAPISRCESMTPGHWITPQTEPSPYQVILSDEDIKEGQRVSIKLISIDLQTPFKGFLVMVKKAGHDSQTYGHFDFSKMDREKCQPLDCFGMKASAVTHADSNEKGFVDLEWVAPFLNGVSVDEYEVRATFVKNFWTIWTNVVAPHKIRVFKDVMRTQEKPKLNEEVTINSTDRISSIVSQNASVIPQVVEERNGTLSGGFEPISEESWGHFKRVWLQLQNFFGLQGQGQGQ